MKKMMALLVMVVLVLGVAVAVCPAAEPKEEAPKILAVGDKVADFKLKDGITGNDVSFDKDYLGKSKLLAISFMNTSCSACNAEIRLLSQMASKYPDLMVVAMAVDSRGEALVKSYNENYKFKVSYVLDPEFTQPTRYGFNYTPAMILADKTGKIVQVRGGFNPVKDGDSLVKEIEAKLQ